MFNGIVYNQGIIKSIRKSPKYVRGSLVIEVASNISFKKSDIGESVCCDGVCLTLISIKIIDRSWNVNFKINKKYRKFIVEKGSISVNGVSLTVSKVRTNEFQITIIPHTLKLTNLINLKIGDRVNIEFDLIGKYLNNIYN